MRGRTFCDSVLIIDEAQNIDNFTMKMCLSRLGKDSKIILCGDTSQTDLKKNTSGLPFLVSLENKIQGLKVVTLKTNHRHPIIENLMSFYDELEEKK